MNELTKNGIEKDLFISHINIKNMIIDYQNKINRLKNKRILSNEYRKELSKYEGVIKGLIFAENQISQLIKNYGIKFPIKGRVKQYI